MDVLGLSIELSGVSYRDSATGRWIAHCLEMDVVAEGDSSEAAFSSLMELCDLQIIACLDDKDLDGIFRPAPSHIWAIFAQAKAMDLQPHRPRSVDRVTLREYAHAA